MENCCNVFVCYVLPYQYMMFVFYYFPSPAATIEESDTAIALSSWGSSVKYLKSRIKD